MADPVDIIRDIIDDGEDDKLTRIAAALGFDDEYFAARKPDMAPRIPKTPEDIRDFIGSDYGCMHFARQDHEPDADDTYTLTAHDLLSAFDWWDFAAPPQAEAPSKSDKQEDGGRAS